MIILRSAKLPSKCGRRVLYRVSTKRFNEQVRRNRKRFPADFMFQLTAEEMSVYVVRAFVQLREVLASNKELARRFAELETRLDKKLTIHDEAIAAILGAIRQRLHPPVPKRRPIRFTADLRQKV
jgi:hypothetical protein